MVDAIDSIGIRLTMSERRKSLFATKNTLLQVQILS